MRSPVQILAVLLIGAVVGLGSTYWAVSTGWQPGLVQIGPWAASGTRLGGADPYALALVARTGDVPLGAGEGVLFIAETDQSGRPLSGACTYAVTGQIPAGRAWTLTLSGRDHRLVDNPSKRHAITSAGALRPVAGPPVIAIASEPQPGNWLPAPSGQPFELALRIYDSPVANAIGSLRPDALPAIQRLACR